MFLCLFSEYLKKVPIPGCRYSKGNGCIRTEGIHFFRVFPVGLTFNNSMVEITLNLLGSYYHLVLSARPVYSLCTRGHVSFQPTSLHHGCR